MNRHLLYPDPAGNGGGTGAGVNSKVTM